MSTLIIGTYTEPMPHVAGHGRGVVSTQFLDGELTDGALVAELRNPSWLTADADGGLLYSVIETDDFEGSPGGGVATVRRGPSGEWRLLQMAAALGAGPAHLELDPSGRYLVVANYADGSIVVFALIEEGRIGASTHRVEHVGSSIHESRQNGPHPHQVVFDPVDGKLLVPDLGLDAVLVYTLDESGHLTEHVKARLVQKPGAGPRHLAFHPDGRHLFVLNELNNTLVVYRRTDSGFVETDVRSTVPDGFSGENLAAAVRVAPSGRFVFVSNRGLNAIAVFEFSGEREAIELKAVESSRGRTPRDIALSPDGQHLVVANQDSDSIVVFATNETLPSLTHVSTTEAASPVCLRFI